MAGFQQYGYMQPPPTSQPPMPASRSTPPPPTGRASSYPDISYDTSSMDPLMEELSKDIEHLNERNKKMIRIDHTKNSYLANTSMVDTLICGGCRFVTCDFEAYKNHRLGQCTKPKADKEPAVLKCASCEQILDSAWALIEHLTDFHRMRLYQLVEEQQPEPAQQEMNTPTREEPIDSPGQ
ncbi:unnamed protein product, partial [Mesorhabditis spiculigera]